jgi:microcystin-dependent protein
MTDQFLGEMRVYPFNIVPTGWALCNGQLMPITQNTALFSLLGTTYGGNGASTFGLPDMQDSVPMHPGQGPGLSLRVLGEASGVDSVALLASEMPAHTHFMSHSVRSADNLNPEALALGTGNAIYVAPPPVSGQLAPQALPPAGGGLPHNNLMPYMTLSFCIALQGLFPARP